MPPAVVVMTVVVAVGRVAWVGRHDNTKQQNTYRRGGGSLEAGVVGAQRRHNEGSAVDGVRRVVRAMQHV